MNTPEKIAQAYLRLNGFFTIPHFTVLKNNGTHVDFLAVRLGGSIEKVGVAPNRIPIEIDEKLLSKLGINENQTIGLVVEVRGGEIRGEREQVSIEESKFEYAESFFGNITCIKKVGFENNSSSEIIEREGIIIVPIKYCVTCIKERFDRLSEIEQQLKGNGVLSKEGSWELSEDFLSDLIYLKKFDGFV